MLQFNGGVGTRRSDLHYQGAKSFPEHAIVSLTFATEITKVMSINNCKASDAKLMASGVESIASKRASQEGGGGK